MMTLARAMTIGRVATGIFTITVLVAFSRLTPSAGAARPTCLGKPATIVGTPANDVLIGTGDADVIVGGRGRDRILPATVLI
jgi:hypothetical protein